MLKIVQALAPGSIQQHEALHEGSLVVTPLPFFHHHVLLHTPRQSQRTKGLHHQGRPPSAVSISSAGWGSTSNNKGDSVGEGFSILRMPVIVPEQRTFEVKIPENSVPDASTPLISIHGLNRVSQSSRPPANPRYQRIGVSPL